MKFIKHENKWVWGESIVVVLANGAGLCTVQFFNNETDIAYITGLSVHKNYRKHGIGKALLHECEKIALEHNKKEIKIHCDKNSFVYDWYIREGFEDTGIIVIGYGDTVVELTKNKK